MATTYNDLYLDIRQMLRKEGLPAATLEARELVCFATGKSREELMRDGGLYMPPDLVERTLTLVHRHIDGVPVAYIIGEWEFYGLPLDISNEVLIPRPDTEVLVEQAIAFCQGKESCRVLDLCAGSGCIGLAMAKHLPQSRVVLADLSEGAVRICRQNTRHNGLNSQVLVLQADALEKPSPALGEFDCIVSNPPYIPTADLDALDTSVKDHEPLMALDGGADGLDFYRSIVEQWRKVLRSGGGLFFEVGIGQAEDVAALMSEVGFSQVTITPDLQGINRVVSGIALQGMRNS